MAERVRTVDESGLPDAVDQTVATVGTFDGLHRGHHDVLERVVARAHETGLHSLLVTFEPHPLEIVNPAKAPPLLTVGEEKMELIAETGLDYVAVVPFTKQLQAMDAETFVDEVLRRHFRMHELLMGYDHGFGKDRKGDPESLRRMGAESGFRVEVVPPVSVGGQPISSSAIRRAVAAGDLAAAAEGLGRPYSVSGVVIQGDRRGRLLGFPTINLGAPPPKKLLPPEGVYAVRAQTPSGTFGGMMNLGARPTFGDARVTLEAHLFDAEAELYGAHVRLDFVARLRETVRFPDVEALVAQLKRDADDARRALRAMADAR